MVIYIQSSTKCKHNIHGIRMSEGQHDGRNYHLCHKVNARMRRLSQLEINPQF